MASRAEIDDIPYLILDSGAGELFIVRNFGNFVPPYDASYGYHGTAEAVEFAVLNLNVSEIIVCGHSHCGAVCALHRSSGRGTAHAEVAGSRS